MRFLLAAMACMIVFFSGSAAVSAAPVPLAVRVVYAHNKTNGIDPKLKKLVRELKSLKFTAYELKDAQVLQLELGIAGTIELPSKDTLTIRPRELADGDKLRVDLEIEKIKLKTTSSIAKDGTLAIGGPPYEDGALIIAITREAKLE